MKLVLQLRHRPEGTPEAQPSHRNEAAAMLLSCAQPADWLTAVCELGLTTSELKFLPLVAANTARWAPEPVKSTDSNAVRVDAIPQDGIFAVLVVGRSVTVSIERIRSAGRDGSSAFILPPLPYRCVAGRLFLPIDAEIFPAVADSEISRLLPSNPDHFLVWHPSAGLIELESHQILSAADLLSFSSANPGSWREAQRGSELNNRIRSLNPVTTIEDLINMIQQGRDDIGQDAGDLGSAPPAPDEVKNPVLNDAKRWLQNIAAKTVFQITDRLPSHESGSQTLARLHEWAMNMLAAESAAEGASAASRGDRRIPRPPNLSTQRENELKRLLHMLDNNPDLGLRYAMPLGDSSSRGTAPPSGRLGERTPDFHFSQLGSSGPADAWDLPWNYRQRLHERYRELAQREIRLGNHRRAAYIYATLLRDLHSAATALEAGRLFHDAAMIFQQHLQQPLKAAACLKNAGMWEEAVTIYREQSQWMEAGELYELLNQPDAARRMYLYEMDTRIRNRKFPEAADLARRQLGDTEQAIELLCQGWTNNSYAAVCLRQLMQLFAEAGQHDCAERSLRQLVSSPELSLQQRCDAVTICSEVATNYPSSLVQISARRQTLTMASALLSRKTDQGCSIATEAVRRLAEDDELLHRDGTRFLTQFRMNAKKNAVKNAAQKTFSQSKRSSDMRQIRSTSGPKLSYPKTRVTVQWHSAVASPSFIFCLGEGSDESAVIGRWPRASFASKTPSVSGQIATLAPMEGQEITPCRLLQNPREESRVWLQQFPANARWNAAIGRQLGQSTSFIDVIAPQADLLLDLAFRGDGSWYAMFAGKDASPRIDAFDSNGLVRESVQLDGIPFDVYAKELNHRRLYVFEGNVVVVMGQTVYRAKLPPLRKMDKTPSPPIACERILELSSPCLELCSSPPATLPRVAIGTADGVSVLWPLSRDVRRIAGDFDRPLITCLPNGLFVVACRSSRKIECYRANKNNLELVAEDKKSPSANALLALLPGPRPDEFLTVQSDLLLRHKSIPLR